jgi:CheY-like chemotaxis protein
MLTLGAEAIEISRSILVVDDERGFCDVVTVILESQGYEVHKAHHANDAFGMLDTARPDLILTDMMMPDIDGVGLIKRLQETPAWADIPVVVISAYSEPEIQENAFEAGASGFMSKPFSATELRTAVGAYFTEN